MVIFLKCEPNGVYSCCEYKKKTIKTLPFGQFEKC